MGFVLGFLPWILYWALIGNVPFRVVVLVVLAVAVATQVLGRVRGEPRRSLETGSLVVFVLLAAAAFVFDDAFLEQWMQPLSNLGIFLVALVGVLTGRPFVREYAAASVDEATARSDGFRVITTGMTWLWVGVFAAMTVISAVPPVVDGAATIRDSGGLLSILCYWVLPYVLLGVGGLVSGLFPPWFEKRSALVEKRGAAPSVVAQPAPPPDEATGGLRLDVPDLSRPDEPFAVAVRGAPAGSAVDLTVSGDDLFGRTWRSEARFTVPTSGGLDSAVDDPAAGDWQHAGPAVPLTALRFATPGVTPDLFVPPAEPWSVTVTATADGGGTARHTVRRSAPRACAGPRSARACSCSPAGPTPPGGWPAVACFGGSEGGYASQIGSAELLASLGFAALAACWVPEGQPVASVPLERFTDALDELAAHADVDAGRVTAMAVSRGAEGLLAAVCATPGQRCRGLVLVSPSSVTWQAIGDDGEIPDTPSWTRAGAPVAWRPLHSGVLMPQLIRNAWRVGADTAAHRPTLLRLRPAYEDGLAHDGPGVIAAENAACPLLVLTGSEDAVWPSGAMARALLARRPAGDTHVDHPGAGHLIRLGALPTDALWTGGIALGGTRDGHADAERDATHRVPAFLREVCGVFAEVGDMNAGEVGTLRLTAPFLPVAGALFCIQLDFFSLSLALPTIAADLGTTTTNLQWLLSGYMIALGALLIPAGRAGDVLGRRTVLLTGVAIFGLTSLVCGLASSVGVLIAARIAQGVGAALIMPTAFALVSNDTTDEVRPRVTGALLGIAGVGTALGPVVGGVLASTAGWQWVFLLNVPIAAFALWQGRHLRDSRDETATRSLRGLDWWGTVAVVGGLAGVSLAIDDVSSQGWFTAVTLVPLVGGIALLGAFAMIEARVGQPLVRSSLLRNRLFVLLAVAGTLANVGSCVYVVSATLELQNVRGYSAAAAGVVFFISSVGLALCGPLSGRLSVRYPAGIVMGVAVLASSPALVLLAFSGPLPFYVVALGLCGITTGMGYALGQVAVQNVLPPERSAEGTSVMLTALICVGGIGVVAATAVIEAVGDQQATDAGISLVLVLVAALLLVAGLATVFSESRRLRAVS